MQQRFLWYEHEFCEAERGTMFRKVKSMQYGPEGKVYEYNFDLGAIPKTVKEIAKANGWKFKTVVLKKKAML